MKNLHRKYINFFTRIIKYGIIIKEIFNTCEVKDMANKVELKTLVRKNEILKNLTPDVDLSE